MNDLYINIAGDMLREARVNTEIITKTTKPELREWYAKQAELYTRIAEAYIKMSADKKLDR